MAWKVVQIITATGAIGEMIVSELEEIFDSEEDAKTVAQQENRKLENTKYLWRHVELE